MLHRVQREIDARHRRDLARPEPARVDDVLRVDRALVGHHLPGAVGPRVGLAHHAVGDDLGARHPRRAGVGVGGARGVEMAVERVVEAAQDAVEVGDRRELRDLLGRHHAGVEAHVLVLGALGAQQVEPVGVGRQRHAADVVEPAGLAGDLLQLAVEADGVALERRHVGVAVQRVEAPRGVPGRARGQLRALQQHHVGPAELGEMVEHRASDDAAADHGDASGGSHGVPALVVRVGRHDDARPPRRHVEKRHVWSVAADGGCDAETIFRGSGAS